MKFLLIVCHFNS